ncbi:hypothetical protein KRR39_17150 [Nocardioides panacis]|uniref:DUF5667 domain-containing protein n=1 Tax=Nocardioides panacis TaxID=2849501 RepID=A0A975XZE9_9ACTN|nr:DUF5667 domain-containing protein [Nocardioides panacis]QWZ07189.1 hypothetical protein KRR39_17150 [Nocardioides panacis]
MTTLFRSRRAEEFAARVDGTGTLRAASDPGTERLLGVAELLRVRAAGDTGATPRDAFAAELRERLMAEAATVLTPQHAALALPPRTRGKRERRLVAVATATVLLGGTAGMATAAQDAMPGEVLYPVKRGIEQAEAGLSLGSAARGRDLLHQATGRLGEAGRLVDRDPSTATLQVPGTISTFTAQATRGSDLLLASYAADGDPATVGTVREFAAASLSAVTALTRTAPEEAQPALRDAALALRDIDTRAGRLCDSCADLPALNLPQAFLASAEVHRAMHRVEVAGLDNSHPVIADKQALRTALRQAAPRRTTTGGGTQSSAGAVPQPPAATPAVPGASDVPAVPSAPSTSKVPVPRLPAPSLPTAAPSLPGAPLTLDPGGLADGLGGVVETILPDPTKLLP